MKVEKSDAGVSGRKARKARQALGGLKRASK
jgi:hypothetical protein